MKYKAKGTGTEVNEIERGGVRNEWKGGRRGREEGEEGGKERRVERGTRRKVRDCKALAGRQLKTRRINTRNIFPFYTRYALISNIETYDFTLFFLFFLRGGGGNGQFTFDTLPDLEFQ